MTHKEFEKASKKLFMEMRIMDTSIKGIKDSHEYKENSLYNSGLREAANILKDMVNSDDELIKCAIWKNHTVIGYIELTEKQRQTLNGISGIDVYFGFDNVTNPERYKKR